MKTVFAALVIALFASFLQICPAPIGGLARIGVRLVKGAVDAGSSINDEVQNNSRRTLITLDGDHFDEHAYLQARDDDPFAGLPEPAATQCKGQLKDVTVSFKFDGNTVTIGNVPATCMTLATVFLGDNPGAHGPIPMSSSSLKYTNVDQGDIQQLRSIMKQ
ncbi:uncharacterized protein EURHEDRAFT_410715 [Aspergillus ruber CBS 135680]|uniref:Uncharacterized protein n=1 Tax=Aspergillus ruber (strain CBS 135680) TaxID=1388766 RepID=A0A017SJ03_ASPRC|nr:uncharacterized protein EURHEDRAFT_410715 [Aspergillus ruber CBS 135680]EYE96922.1 hypothetical protein EURHEDRAFT_410715 [Aspergillus ruber CBS 135680]